MDVISELGPVFRAEARRMLRDGSAVRNGLIAGEDATMQEAGPRAVDGELEIAIEITIADALLEAVGNVFEIADLDDPAHFYPAAKAEFDSCDQAEHPIAADGQAKKLRVGLAAAFAKLAVRIEQGERFHVADDRLVLEHAAVDV